jgi:NO-binding membrane sensor protein with MHYT domain
MATSQGVPRLHAPLWVSFRMRLLALAALIAVAAAVLALSLAHSSNGSPGTQVDHRVAPKTVAPMPHRLVGGRF